MNINDEKKLCDESDFRKRVKENVSHLVDNVNQKNYNLLEKGGVLMTTPTQIRIDSEIKKQANELFKTLGLDMSSAVNLFLYQCVLRGGLPFKVETPRYNEETLKAMAEAIKISKDDSVPSYTSMEDLHKALMED